MKFLVTFFKETESGTEQILIKMNSEEVIILLSKVAIYESVDNDFDYPSKRFMIEKIDKVISDLS